MQVVEYGPTHEDLPRMLQRINPNAERAFARRVLLIREIREAGDPTQKAVVADLMRGTANSDRHSDTTFADAAERLLAQRRRTTVQLRGDLEALQRLSRTMVDVTLVRQEIRRWLDREVRDFKGRFRRAVRQAAGALALYPETLLNAMKRRGIDVHGRWLSGYCIEVLRDLESGRRQLRADAYALENMKRILTTLQAVLEADASVLFPDPTRRGSLTTTLPRRCLVIARYDRLELRDPANPQATLAALKTDVMSNLDVQVARLADAPAILAFNTERLFAWDPRRAPDVLAEFSVGGAYGINGVAHLQTPEGLRSFVTTTAGPTYVLRNLELEDEWVSAERHSQFLHYPVALPDSRLFALEVMSSGSDRLIELGTDGRIISHGTLRDLADALGQLPGVPWASRRPKRQLQHEQLGWTILDGRPLLVMQAQVLGKTWTDSVVLLIHPTGAQLDIRCHFYIEGQLLADVCFVPGQDGALRLVGVLLSDFRFGYDLVVWARATQTSRSMVFVEEGSTLRTEDDLVGVVALHPGLCFAFDDSGGLFAFSMNDGSYKEVARDPKSRIRGLQVIEW